ncbi:hypothetical protein C8Q78DRAFT_984589 [Trametes maxima]|nr:hypothetical protein C8Q78DRAFT_984589 [Trametes maxima]
MVPTADLVIAFIVLGPVVLQGTIWIFRKLAAPTSIPLYTSPPSIPLYCFQPISYTFSASVAVHESVVAHLHFTPPSSPHRNVLAVPTPMRIFEEDSNLSSGIRSTLRPLVTLVFLTFQCSIKEFLQGPAWVNRRRRTCRPAGGNGDSVVIFWWESKLSEKISAPPDLSGRKELVFGDVFLHRSPGPEVQLWLWIPQESSHGIWLEVYVGYIRDDGRVLGLTERNKLPSWYDYSWYMKRVSQSKILCLVVVLSY